MDNSVIFVLLAVLHVLLWLFLPLAGRKGRARLSAGELLFCALIPVFGPLGGLCLLYAPPPEEGLLQDMIMREDPLRRSYIASESEASSTVPMEEAFLISEPHVRREMMMKLLRSDPDRNNEILMMARFNDDPETAHYATATLSEYQRRIEMTLQESQALLSRQPDDTETRLQYIRQMQGYIDSGLLEGNLLRRQRTMLDHELAMLSEEDTDLPLGCLKCRNLLALGRTADAKQAARQMAEHFPQAEEPWLEMMRIAVDSRDIEELRSLRQQIGNAAILWSYKGQQKMNYFLEGIK